MKKFKLDYSFILFVLLLAFSPKQGLLLKVILSLCLHEIGHLILVYLFSYPVEEIKLSLFGFTMRLKETQQFFYKDLLIYAGGVLMNALLYIIIPNEEWRNIQLFLILLNLIPIYPLDGFNIMKTAASYVIPYFHTLFLTSIFSVIVNCLVLVLCFIYRVDVCLWVSFSYLLITNTILLFQCQKRYRYFLVRKELYPYSYPIKIIQFKKNYKHYLYYYHTVTMKIGNKNVEQSELLAK